MGDPRAPRRWRLRPRAPSGPAQAGWTPSVERSIRRLLLAILVVPALLLSGFAWHLHRTHFAQAWTRLGHLLDVVDEHAAKVFETHDLAVGQVNQLLSGLPDEEVRRREEELHDRLAAVVRGLDQVQDLWVIDRLGHPLVGAAVFPQQPGLDLSDRDYFRMHRDGLVARDAAYVSDPVPGRAVDGSYLHLFSKRRELRAPTGHAGAAPDAAFAGVVAVSVDVRYFERFYARVAANGLTSVAMVRADGSVLARYPAMAGPPGRVSGRMGLLPAIASAPDQGTYEAVSKTTGSLRLFAYKRLATLPIYVVVGLDRSAILAGWLHDLGSYLLLAVPAVAALFLLALLALRKARQEAGAARLLAAESTRRTEAEQRLARAQRMEAVGQLTAGVAHDFNNLLQAQVANLDLLLDALGQPGGEARAQELAERAIAIGERGAKLTHQLLAFSRKQVLQPQAVSLAPMLREFCEVLTRTLGPQVGLTLQVPPGTAAPYADPAQLEAAVLNLCLNARDAMPGGGMLLIEAEEATADQAQGRAELAPGPYVVLAVSDTGTGMDAATLARVCEPFFTTKEVGKGSGLGLSMVQGFARQSGGELIVQSAPGEGTRCEIWLPRARQRDAAGPAAGGGKLRGTGRILLVDDMPEVLAALADGLEEAGFAVTQATRSQDALGMMRAGQRFDVLVTDYAMPGLDGGTLVRHARTLQPGLPAIVVTGFADTILPQLLPPGVKVLRKPFRTDVLVREVHGQMGHGQMGHGQTGHGQTGHGQADQGLRGAAPAADGVVPG